MLPGFLNTALTNKTKSSIIKHINLNSICAGISGVSPYFQRNNFIWRKRVGGRGMRCPPKEDVVWEEEKIQCCVIMGRTVILRSF